MAEIGFYDIDTGYSFSNKQVRIDFNDVSYSASMAEEGYLYETQLVCSGGTITVGFERTGRRTALVYFDVGNTTIFDTDESGSGVSNDTVDLSSYSLSICNSIQDTGDYSFFDLGVSIFYFDTASSGGGGSGGDEGDDPGTSPEQIVPDNKLHTILNRIVSKLSKTDEKLNYCMDMASNEIDLSSVSTWTSLVSGVTVNTSSCKVSLIGNILYVYGDTSLTSSAISTGSQTSDYIQLTIQDLVHRSSSLPYNTALNHIRYLAPTYQAFPGGGGNSNSRAIALYTVVSVEDGPTTGYMTATIKIKLSYVKAVPTVLRFAIQIPVVRCELNQEN